MSVGFFIGIRGSYEEDEVDSANDYIDAANRALAKAGLPAYVEPEPAPDVYNGSYFGRSSLDHHGAGCLQALGELAEAHGIKGHIALLAMNPFWVAFLPADFAEPLLTEHVEHLGRDAVPIWIGSAPGLLRDAQALAPHLGITLRDGLLDDALATKIDDMEPFGGDEDPTLVEKHRTAWLLVHEGARLAIAHGVALSLAG